MVTPQRISPNLWFDDQAEEAARFYIGIFKNSRIRDDQSIRQGRVRDSPSAGRIGGDGGRVRAGNGSYAANEEARHRRTSESVRRQWMSTTVARFVHGLASSARTLHWNCDEPAAGHAPAPRNHSRARLQRHARERAGAQAGESITRIEFRAPSDAVMYLRFWKRDAGAMADLRYALSRYRQGPLPRFSDDEVIEALAVHLAHGELVVAAERALLRPSAGRDTGPITGTRSAAEAAPPAASISTAPAPPLLPAKDATEAEADAMPAPTEGRGRPPSPATADADAKATAPRPTAPKSSDDVVLPPVTPEQAPRTTPETAGRDAIPSTPEGAAADTLEPASETKPGPRTPEPTSDLPGADAAATEPPEAGAVPTPASEKTAAAQAPLDADAVPNEDAAAKTAKSLLDKLKDAAAEESET
jgi:hypothetical protein